MTPLVDDLKAELERLRAQLVNEVADPAHRIAIAQMTTDLAMLPVRLARGEDVTALLASLKAEGLNRGLALVTRSQALVLQSWITVLSRILFGALAVA